MSVAGTYQVDIKYRLNLDQLKRLSTELKSIATRFRQIPIRVDVKSNIANIKSELRSLKSKPINIPVNYTGGSRSGLNSGSGGGSRSGSNSDSGIGSNMAAAGIDVVTSATKNAIVAAATYEEKMIDVKVALNAVGEGTPEELRRLTELTKQIGATTKFSANEAASATEMLVRNGVSAKDIIGGMLTSTIDMSIAMRSDLAETADLMTDVMAFYKTYGITAKQASDTVVAATLTSKFGFQDMAYAMARGGTAASAYGVKVNELAAVLAGISPGFKSGAEAGTSFKWLLKSLDGKSAKAAKEIKSLGLELVNQDGTYRSMREIIGELTRVYGSMEQAERNAAITSTFHGYALNAVIGLLNLGVDGYDKLLAKQSLVSASNIARQKESQGLTMAYIQLTSAIEGLYLVIVNDSVLKWLSNFTITLTEIVTNISNLISSVTAAEGVIGKFKAGIGEIGKITESNSFKDTGRKAAFSVNDPEWLKSVVNWGREGLGMQPLGTDYAREMSAVRKNPAGTSPLTSFKPNLKDKLLSGGVINNVKVEQTFNGAADPSKVREASEDGIWQAMGEGLYGP